MALTNSQYDIIMREYQAKQLKAMRDFDSKVARIHQELPELQALEDEATNIRSSSYREIISGSNDALSDTKNKLDNLILRKKSLLESHGYSLDDLASPTYSCNDCRDSGFLPGKIKCHCFKQATIKLIYESSHMGDILNRENFDTYSLEIYSDDPTMADNANNATPREYAANAYNVAQDFCDNFEKSFSNMYIYGEPGVGKTFLTNCIAKKLMDNEHSVIYLGSSSFFDMYSKQTFKNDSDASELVGDFLECDLLIIDDIGTELTNSFTVSKLFYCIDERIRTQKSTIISSNLDPVQFMDIYSERIFSRITNCYTIIKLTGDDLRRRNRRN